MEFIKLLNKNTSYQENSWSEISKEQSVKEIFTEIKSDKYKTEIQILRSFLQKGDKEKYDIYKKRLPAVTFCGTFNKQRKKSFLQEYNQIIVLDIDKLSESELERIENVLQNDEFVSSFWRSPSDKGIKGLTYLRYDLNIDLANIDSYHKSAFKKLSNYFSEKYNIELDNSGSDTTRLCFLSYDPKIVIKNEFSFFKISEVDIKLIDNKKSGVKTKEVKYSNQKDALLNPDKKNNPFQRKTIQSIIKYLSNRGISITESYEEWYRVGYSIANSFTHDVGEKYYLKFCELDVSKYEKVNCQNMLRSCYENNNGSIKFATIEYFAKEKGYIYKNTGESDVSIGGVSTDTTYVSME